MKIKDTVIINIKGTGIPKPTNDQNTDDITPARYLKEITFKNMGGYAFYDERFIDGKEVEDHPFNNKKYKGATILVAGANFGCGSSREHAPQALHRYGIKVIIAESFAEIFAGNCASLGVVGITVSGDDIKMIADSIKEKPKTEFDINLENNTITFGENTFSFKMPEGRRQAFIDGTWDAMTILQQNQDGIKEVVSNLEYLSFN